MECRFFYVRSASKTRLSGTSEEQMWVSASGMTQSARAPCRARRVSPAAALCAGSTNEWIRFVLRQEFDVAVPSEFQLKVIIGIQYDWNGSRV